MRVLCADAMFIFLLYYFHKQIGMHNESTVYFPIALSSVHAALSIVILIILLPN